MLGQYAHHTAAQVAVQTEVRRERRNHLLIAYSPLYLKPWFSHFDAQCFGFAATRYDATIITR
jgi:hypothetical protein